MSVRDIKLGQLQKLRQQIKKLDAQAANHLIVLSMKSVAKPDLSKLDVDAIYQAAEDLRNTVLLLREAKENADTLHEELYD